MLAVDQRVRHRKQPAWGIGLVKRVATVGGMVELVIEFAELGERLLKLKPEMVDAMIEPLSAADNQAIDDAASAKVAARRSGMRSKKHAARARVVADSQAAISIGDGLALVAPLDGGTELRVYAADGSVVERIELPDPEYDEAAFSPGDHFAPSRLVTDGRGLVVGTRTHNWGMGLFARRGQTTARMWRSPIEIGVPDVRVVPGVGALVHDLHHVVLVREDGSASVVPFVLEDERTISAAVPWADGILVATHGEDDRAGFFQFVYIGYDGEVRHRGPGAAPSPIDDDLMLAFDQRGVMSRDRAGGVTGRLEVPASWPMSNSDEAAFTRVDDELVFVTAQHTGLVRWHPRVDAPRWVCKLTDERDGLVAPVRVGRFLAATSSELSSTTTPRVWVVDAETGALAHVLELRTPASALVPVGDDALVAVSYSTQPAAWRGLARGKPERLTLAHAQKCGGAVALGSNTVMTVDLEGLSFFDL